MEASGDKRVVFVSGHLDLTKEEFAEHYEPQLRAALDAGASFVVGDAPGCDFMAQRWLWKNVGEHDRNELCRVFHMLERPRHSFGSGYGSHDPNLKPSGGGFPLVGGFKSDEERDAAMTAASTHDIAWVRPTKGKKSSGTAKNLHRRSVQREAAREAEVASWPTVKVSTAEIWPHYWVQRVERSADEAEAGQRSCGPTLYHVPQQLIDQMAAAWEEYSRCQREIERLLHEQGYDS